jgi:hypothetical protein
VGAKVRTRREFAMPPAEMYQPVFFVLIKGFADIEKMGGQFALRGCF